MYVFKHIGFLPGFEVWTVSALWDSKRGPGRCLQARPRKMFVVQDVEFKICVVFSFQCLHMMFRFFNFHSVHGRGSLLHTVFGSKVFAREPAWPWEPRRCLTR